MNYKFYQIYSAITLISLQSLTYALPMETGFLSNDPEMYDPDLYRQDLGRKSMNIDGPLLDDSEFHEALEMPPDSVENDPLLDDMMQQRFKHEREPLDEDEPEAPADFIENERLAAEQMEEDSLKKDEDVAVDELVKELGKDEESAEKTEAETESKEEGQSDKTEVKEEDSKLKKIALYGGAALLGAGLGAGIYAGAKHLMDRNSNVPAVDSSFPAAASTTASMEPAPVDIPIARQAESEVPELFDPVTGKPIAF